MKINISFIITIFANAIFLITATLFIVTSATDYKNTLKHYQTVSKIQAYDFDTNIIKDEINDITDITKESDNVYIVKTNYDIKIPILFYEENRTIETYVSR